MRDDQRLKSPRRYFAAVTLVTISLVVSLLLGEFAVRMFLKHQIVLFPRYHAAADYGEFTIRRFRPDTVFWHTSIDGKWKFEINSRGFRNSSDIHYEKPPHTFRILSLGDSHTAGFEVRQDHTFSAVIERVLKENGITAEVINAGVSGFSTAEEYVFLKNEGMKYKPDVVVLGFFANDFEDNIKAGLFALQDNGFVTQKKQYVPGVGILTVLNEFWITRWLSENSYLYSFALNTAWNSAKRLLRTKAQARLETEFAIPTEEVNDYRKQLAGRLIEEIYALCRREGVKFIILDIPRLSKWNHVRSSVPPDMVEAMRLNSDVFLYSREVFPEGFDASKLHVPHGHRHISEFTHQTYGVEVAQAILEFLGSMQTLKRIQYVEGLPDSDTKTTDH